MWRRHSVRTTASPVHVKHGGDCQHRVLVRLVLGDSIRLTNDLHDLINEPFLHFRLGIPVVIDGAANETQICWYRGRILE